MSEAKKILVVGAGWDQAPIIRSARQQGHYVIAIDGDSEAYGLQFANCSYTVSTRDVVGVLKIAQEERVNAATYMITESPLYSIFNLTQALGLPGPSRESVEATVSKIRMREIFEAAGVPNPRFGRAKTLIEAVELAQYIGFPLVMKPADVGGQLGLAKVHTFSDLEEYFVRAQKESIGGEVILEELMMGSEVNVVAIVLHGKIEVMTVSDRIKHPELAFGVVMRHLYPAACLPQQENPIRDYCQQAAMAMRIKDGIIFPQLIMTSAGPRMVEIGARIPGGVMKELFELATGYDLVALQLDMALGKEIDLQRYVVQSANQAVTVKFLTSQPGILRPGLVAEVTGVEDAKAIEGVVDVQYYNDPTRPQTIRPLCNGRDRFFYIIAVGSSRKEVVERSDLATTHLDFLDEAGNKLKVSDDSTEKRYDPEMTVT